MVAGHQRKRLNGASIAGSTSWDHYRTKKKKLESFRSDLNVKSHVSLEWDGIQNKVIAKREQVSLCQRDLRPFINLIPQHSNVLGDVFSVPQEIFGLESLKEVLSYEVWQNYLSENERNMLVQFLPGGLDHEEVVEALLSGENFHFGNPFLEWGSTLYSGNLHPDAVFNQEERLMADKRVYYSEIQKYHANMIKYLQKLKDTWESSKDTEMEVLQKIWRSRKGLEKKNSKVKNESRFPNDNAATTSESCSWVADDKACSSDNQISSVMKGRSLRNQQKSSSKQKHKKLLVASDEAEKGDNVHKCNIHHSDGARYMSCLKISKKQHELVKSMKQSGKSIQSRSLNRVLGNINSLHVQPYEEFVKEEKKKLQEHWLQLANIDLPAAYAKWREGQLQRGEIIMSLGQEMEDKLKFPFEDEEKDNPELVLHDHDVVGERNLKANKEDEEPEEHVNQLEDQNDLGVKSQETGVENYEDSSGSPWDQNDGPRNQQSSVENNEYAGSGLPHCLSPDQASSLSGGHESNPKDVGSEDILVASKSGDVSPDKSNYPMNGSTADASIDPVIPFSSGGNLYSRGVNNADSSIGHRVSFSSGGNGYSAHANNPDSSIYQGVPISSGGDMYAVDVNDGDASVSQKVPVSSGGVMYVVDVNNADAPVTQGAPISSGGDMYPVDVNNADSSINQGVTISSAADMCLEDANNADASIGQGAMPCGRDGWSVVNMEQSYYNPTGKEEYASHHGLHYPHQPNGQQRPRLIDLELDVHAKDMRKDILHRQCDDGSFGSYPNHDRSGLLQSMFNGQEVLSYQHEQKHIGLDFRSPNNVFLQDGAFTGHIQDHLQTLMPMEQVKKRNGENYMPQNVTTEIYPEAGEYLITRQGHVPPVNLQQWAINSVRMPAQSQSHLPNDGMLTQNWFPSEHQVRAGWSGSNGAGVPSQNIVNNADQSLYSVLSQCNQLRSDRHFDSMGSTEQFMLPRNYTMVSAGAPRISTALLQPTHPLDYLGGRDTGSSLMSEDMGWMNLSQNSASHDPLGKPYLRSWNQ